MPRLIDLTGKKFERLIVLERDYEIQKAKNSKDVFWKVQCECGKIFSVRGQDLRQGKQKSCGCLRKEITGNKNFIDVTGQRFGKLTVMYKCDFLKDKHITWHCKCSCGNECDINGRHLRSGAIQSCGCLKSAGETTIIHLLQKMEINFQTQKSFDGCKNKNTLKFDFYLPDYNMVIEYQGEQHYHAIKYFGGEERFQQQQKIDKIKKDWCSKNGINYLAIPYTDFSLLDTKYLTEKIKGYSNSN